MKSNPFSFLCIQPKRRCKNAEIIYNGNLIINLRQVVFNFDKAEKVLVFCEPNSLSVHLTSSLGNNPKLCIFFCQKLDKHIKSKIKSPGSSADMEMKSDSLKSINI